MRSNQCAHRGREERSSEDEAEIEDSFLADQIKSEREAMYLATMEQGLMGFSGELSKIEKLQTMVNSRLKTSNSLCAQNNTLLAQSADKMKDVENAAGNVAKQMRDVENAVGSAANLMKDFASAAGDVVNRINDIGVAAQNLIKDSFKKPVVIELVINPRGDTKNIITLAGKMEDVGSAAENAANKIENIGTASRNSTDAIFKMPKAMDLLKMGLNGAKDLVISLAKELVRIQEALDQMDIDLSFLRSIENMTGSSEIAEAALSHLKDTVNGTGYGMETATQAALAFAKRGMNMGGAVEQVRVWGDAVAYYGQGTDEQLQRVLSTVDEMSKGAKIDPTHLEALFDIAGIDAIELYGEAVGRTRRQVESDLESGAVSATDFLNTMTQIFSEGPAVGTAKDMEQTWETSFDNLKGSIAAGWADALAEVDQVLADEGLPSLKDMLETLGEIIYSVISGIGKVISWVLPFFSPFIWVGTLIYDIWSMIVKVVGDLTAKFNKLAGTSYSITEVIMLAFALLRAFLFNTFFLPLWNMVVEIVNFIGNAFNDPIAAIKVAFHGLTISALESILKIAEGIEEIIHNIPWLENVDLTSGLEDAKNRLKEAQQSIKDESGWIEFVQRMEPLDYNQVAMEVHNKSIKKDSPLDESNGFQSPAEQMLAATENTANNTGAMANSMEISGEDLKYMRDIADREAINRFTTAELSVNMQTSATVNGSLDIDGIISQLEEKTHEMLVVAAEGV